MFDQTEALLEIHAVLPKTKWDGLTPFGKERFTALKAWLRDGGCDATHSLDLGVWQIGVYCCLFGYMVGNSKDLEEGCRDLGVGFYDDARLFLQLNMHKLPRRELAQRCLRMVERFLHGDGQIVF